MFDGFQRVLSPITKKDKDAVLPEMKSGRCAGFAKTESNTTFYQAASSLHRSEFGERAGKTRYWSAFNLCRDNFHYSGSWLRFRLRNVRFYAQKIGDIVTERLVESFADLMNYSFTAKMESALDDVAQGRRKWHDLLDSFYAEFSETLRLAQGEAEGSMRTNSPTETDIECPTCGRPMQIRTGSTGVFLGCSGYALPPKERCKKTMNLVPGEEAVNVDEDEEAEAKLLIKKHHCKICGYCDG